MDSELEREPRKANYSKLDAEYKTVTIFRLAIVIVISSWSSGYQLGAFNPWQAAVAHIFEWRSMRSVYVGILTALFPLGGVVGALVGQRFAKSIGRRKTLLTFAIVQCITCVFNLIPFTITFACARFISGVCSGCANLIAPIYIGEMCPAAIRGKVALLFPISVVMGTLTAMIIGIPLGFQVNPWYWMVVFIFPVTVSILQIWTFVWKFKYDSPVWLMENQLPHVAKQAISQLYNQRLVNEVFNNLMVTTRKASDISSKDDIANATISDFLCKKRYRKITTLAIFIQMFNILGGYNAISFYSTHILIQEGATPGVAALAATGLATVKVSFNFVTMPIIDSYGRRPLLLLGMLGMALSTTTLGFFALYQFPLFSKIIVIIIFLFFYSCSLGPVGWVYISDIMNLNGIVLAMISFWTTLAVLGAAFPLASSPDVIDIYGVFWFFAICTTAGFTFILAFAPETKGMDKRDISKMLEKKD